MNSTRWLQLRTRMTQGPTVESGQKRYKSATDDQTACAFCIRHPRDRSPVFAAPQKHRREFRVRTVGLG